MSPLWRTSLFALAAAVALAFVACQARSWRGPGAHGEATVAAPPNGSSGAGWWRSGADVEPDLSDEAAVVEAIRAELGGMREADREKVLAPWLPQGPMPAISVGSTLADGGMEFVDVAAPRPEQVDLPAVVHALYEVHGTRALTLAAFFAGTDAVARARRRLKLEPAAIDLDTLSARLTPRENRQLRNARDAETWATLYALTWPVDRNWRITSGFGMRWHPVLGELANHRGIDIGVPWGTTVRAPADGVVVRVRQGKANGRWMELDHGHGVHTLYCHLSQPLLKRGAKVKQGDVIAESGDTGRVTGPHLHYQVKLSGEFVDPLSARVALDTVSQPISLHAPPPTSAQAASR